MSFTTGEVNSYTLKLQMRFTVNIAGEVSAEGITGHQHLCHVLTSGVFPTMSITDARCYGSLMGMSKKQLWSLLSLDE